MTDSETDGLEERPAMYKAYVSGLCKEYPNITPQSMAKSMVLTYLHFRILKLPLNMYWEQTGDIRFFVPSGKRLQNTMENHHFQWESSLFLWPFSIAMFNYQRVVFIKDLDK